MFLYIPNFQYPNSTVYNTQYYCNKSIIKYDNDRELMNISCAGSKGVYMTLNCKLKVKYFK